MDHRKENLVFRTKFWEKRLTCNFYYNIINQYEITGKCFDHSPGKCILHDRWQMDIDVRFQEGKP